MRPYYCADNGRLGEVTVGNVSDSTAWDVVYDQITDRFSEAKFIVMNAGYKTLWIAKKPRRTVISPFPILCVA